MRRTVRGIPAVHGIPAPHPARRSRAALGTLTAAGTLLALLLPTGQAGAAPQPGHHSSATPRTTLGAFWTADRMRAAAPLDLATPTKRSAAAVPRSAPLKVAPTLPRLPKAGPLLPGSLPQAGGPWTGGGAVVKTTGRVFFTYQGRNASCSGDAVTSGNKSTVITAGHCVKLQGAWHTNWVFVPGYQDGQAPYGKWPASKTLATPQWTASEDINFDVGAAVVAPLDGKKLTDVVGGQGLSFNSGYNKATYAFGFPAAAPYDGSKLIYCSGNTIKDPLFSNDHGLSCNMTGGSSGGPWFTSFDEKTGTGLQTSVNSFGYQFLPNTMFGPYFGDDAKNLYNKAQTS
ncbi:peptidase [Streptomyces sp. Je 1-4]|uniref:trypsin-like serine peptidase n=1 Tax=Streptomyces TaxID=1883 RepID=UPI0021D9192F|nr:MULTISPECIES: peptidase [unclassified Streptomyces]UYB42732.1 peptidase [Streptomyces sp. Je 1-4]UZQ39059.1 peptidase [Streptomyces sp. Je 1-4] [Streptomyces sp. Je 1-4 4N24]UZQ46476.1 peptidase [Streptomyces sp. Je 1-4] [Streptomyces sp. Je 1-4 4N24_ara]